MGRNLFHRFAKSRIFSLKVAYSAARRRSMPSMRVVGITGSSGKSTTTALLSQILSQHHRITLNRLDNHIGAVARVLRRAPKDTDFAILEVSAGEEPKIARTAKMIRPDVAIVTMIGLEHYKTFRTSEAVAHEKGHLVAALPSNGLALLNLDDALVIGMAARSKARVVTFGLTGAADYIARDIRSTLADGLHMIVQGNGHELSISVALFGVHFYLPVLAAVSCALELGIEADVIKEALYGFQGYPNRCGIIHIPDGPIFIADTCKCPEHSVTLPMEILKGETAPRKTIVLGQISDYAGNPRKVYSCAARYALTVADRLILTGPTAHKAKLPEPDEDTKVLRLPEVQNVARFLKETAIPGEIILLKSSQNIHLDRVHIAFRHNVSCEAVECGRMSGCSTCGLYSLPFPDHPTSERQRRRLVENLRSGAAKPK